jgi:hypothetical protein
MPDDNGGQFGSGLNFGSDQQSQPSPAPSSSGGSLFGAHYAAPDPSTSPLDQSADLLTQRVKRANQIATNPLAQVFAPEQVQAARDFVPKAVEQLQTVQKQKADIAAGRQQAQMLGLDPGEVSDQATREDRIAAAQQRALGGDLKAFQGLQAVEPKAAEAIQDQVHSAISRNLDTAQSAFDSLSNVKTQDEYAAKLASMRNAGDLKNLEALGLKMPGQLNAFNAAKGREAEALRNARIGVDTIRQRLEDRNTYQPMPEAEAKTYTGRLTTAYGDKFDNGTWSRNSAAGTRGYVVNGAANPSDLGRTFTLGSADQRKQLGDQADGLVPKDEREKYRDFNRTYRLATTDAKGNPLPAGAINTNPNVQQGIAEGLASMLRGGSGGANIGLLKIETNKRGFIQGLIDKISTEKAAAINELKGADVNPYLSKLTQGQIRDVMDVLKQYNDQSFGNRMNTVAERAGALGFDSSAVGFAKGEGGAIEDAVERGRQAQIARMTPSHQAIGGGDGVFQIGAQRPGAGATSTPEGSNKTTQLPGAPALRTPVQQSGGAPPPSPPAGTPMTTGAASSAGGPAGGGGGPSPTGPMRPDGTPSPPVGGSTPGRSGLPPGMKLDNPQALDAAANRTIQIESGFKPGQKTGSYVGLGQWSKAEMLRHGITDPDDVEQTRTALKADMQDRAAKLAKDGFPATAANVYLMHQQGEAGLEAHLRNPDGNAWENLKPYYRTDSLAKQAVWGNMTPQMRAQFPNGVGSVTSGDFTRLWEARYNGTDSPGAGDREGAQNIAYGLAKRDRPPRMTEAETVSKNYDEMPWYKKAVAGLLFGRDAEGGVEAAKQYGPEGGSIVGAAAGGMAGPAGVIGGGAAGGAAGQSLKDWFRGNPQNPTEIAKQGALGGVLGVAPEGRPIVGALARIGGAGTVEGGAKAIEGGDAGDVAEAATQGATGAAVGEAFGRALGMVGHKVWNLFSPDAKTAVQTAAKKFSEADEVLKTEPSKITSAAGSAPNPKYDAADRARTEAETVLKDAGLKPDEAAYAHKVSSEGVPAREAEVTRPGAVERARIGAGYQQIESEVGATGVGAPKAVQRTIVPGTPKVPYAETYPENGIYYVDPAKVDAAWSRDKSFYVGPAGGGETASQAKYDSAKQFLRGAKEFNAPELGVQTNGSVGFTDGRHRFAALRDMSNGRAVPVAMDPQSAANAAKAGYITSGPRNGGPTLTDGPMAVAQTAKMSPAMQNTAERAEMAITAPAKNWQEKWVQLKDARSALLDLERDAMTSTTAGRTQSAQDYRALADGVRKQQEKAANYVFGSEGGKAVIGRLKALDTRYARLMNATNGMQLDQAAALKGEAGRQADRAFRAFAQDDKLALRAWDAMRVKAGTASADTEKSILSQIRLENVPVIGKYLAAGKSALDLSKWAREKAAGNPAKFEDLVPELAAAKAERARTGRTVRNVAGMAGARLGVEATQP